MMMFGMGGREMCGCRWMEVEMMRMGMKIGMKMRRVVRTYYRWRWSVERQYRRLL